MKNVKIDDKSRFLSAVLLTIVLCGVAFFLGYRKFEDNAARLQGENNALRDRIASLQAYYDTEEQNKADTETMTAEITDIFSHYSADARFEDGIYEAFNLRAGSGNTFELDSIGFNSPSAIRRIPIETVSAAQIEGFDSEIAFDKFDVSYRGNISYEGLKSMVREISTGEYNLAIGQMSYSILDNGNIDGNALLSFYYVEGAGCSYEEPPVSNYDTGLENLFGVSTPAEPEETDEN